MRYDPTQLIYEAKKIGITVPGKTMEEQYTAISDFVDKLLLIVTPREIQSLSRDGGIEVAASYLVDRAGEYHQHWWAYQGINPSKAKEYEMKRDLCHELKDGIRGFSERSVREKTCIERRGSGR